MRLRLAVMVMLVLTAVPGVRAQPAPPAVDGPIERLKAGEYLWAPAVAPAGPVLIVVSLKAQRAYVYRNGVPIGVSTVSTGKPGYATPTGIFTILQKAVDHRSNLYNDAPMPFMQRLTWQGVAMHAGHLPGYPASHGCIRLPAEFAKLLFGITRLGLTVVITNAADAPEVAVEPAVLDQDAAQADGRFSWHPERSRSGPVSIVVSGRDRRVVVLRNGVEIGASQVVVDGAITTTEAFTANLRDATGVHWLRIPLPASASGAGPDASGPDPARFHLPDAFRTALRDIIQPGTTLLITRDTLRSGGTGTPLTVIAAGR